MSSGTRFPRDLVTAQHLVWACEATTRAFVLDGPSCPVAEWPLPRQTEFLRLRAAQESAQLAVREHPVMAAAIADHRWASTLRALCETAGETAREAARESVRESREARESTRVTVVRESGRSDGRVSAA